MRYNKAVILADLFNVQDLLPFAVFGTFAALAWWALEFVSARKPRAIERLDELKNPRARRPEPDPSALKKRDRVTRVLEKATPALAKPLEPKSELERSQLKTKLANAGFRGETAPSVFLGLKFAGLLTGLFLGGGTVLGLGGINRSTLMWTVIVAGFCFYLPDLIVWFVGRKRKEGIFLGLPDALDLMVVCVEAGLGLDQAMRKVSEEMRNTYRVIAEEFGLANFQLQMGRGPAFGICEAWPAS
jgi:tight adherence protein C